MTSLLEISNKEIKNMAVETVNDEIYHVTEPMLWDMLNRFPENKEDYQITAKVVLIDLLYSTQIFRFAGMGVLPKLVENIRTILDFDERIASGDPSVVGEIYRGFDKRLFSFSTKYCCLHNTVVYGRDDYSIYDSTVRQLLPKYARKVGVPLTGAQIDRWVKEDDYKSFNDAVTTVLNAAEISIENRKRNFDLFLWGQRNNK